MRGPARSAAGAAEVALEMEDMVPAIADWICWREGCALDRGAEGEKGKSRLQGRREEERRRRQGDPDRMRLGQRKRGEVHSRAQEGRPDS